MRKYRMTHQYTELELRKLKGQALKDVWHLMIGKEAGIKNTTGLPNGEAILQAILKGQANPDFLEPYKVKRTRHKAEEKPEVEEMPKPQETKEVKKRGPKPKPKVNPNPICLPPTSVEAQAVESSETPLQVSNVVKYSIYTLIVGEQEYFVDRESKKIFEKINRYPGKLLGVWNAQTKQILPYEEDS
jgi:hypothetical protein